MRIPARHVKQSPNDLWKNSPSLHSDESLESIFKRDNRFPDEGLKHICNVCHLFNVTAQQPFFTLLCLSLSLSLVAVSLFAFFPRCSLTPFVFFFFPILQISLSSSSISHCNFRVPLETHPLATLLSPSRCWYIISMVRKSRHARRFR